MDGPRGMWQTLPLSVITVTFLKRERGEEGKSVSTSHWQEPHINFWGLFYGELHTQSTSLFILFTLHDFGWLTETHLKRERTMTASRTPRPCTLLIQEQHLLESRASRQGSSSPAITSQHENPSLFNSQISFHWEHHQARLLCVGRKLPDQIKLHCCSTEEMHEVGISLNFYKEFIYVYRDSSHLSLQRLHGWSRRSPWHLSPWPLWKQ